MYMTSKKTSNSGPKVDARFHDGIWLGLRMKSDESIIGTPNGVIKAKTVRRLPEDQRWRTEEVSSIRGIPSNPVPSAGKDHIPTEVKGTKHAERGEDEHAPARERKKCDVRPTVATPEPTVRRMHMTRTHTREYGATEGCPRCKGIEAGRSMPHNNECKMKIKARMEQSEEGREGLKNEEQRQDRHLERGDRRSVERGGSKGARQHGRELLV